MNRARAIQLAVAAMRAERRRLAPQANLYTLFHCDTPGTRAAAKQYTALGEAIDLLEQPEPPLQQTMELDPCTT